MNFVFTTYLTAAALNCKSSLLMRNYCRLSAGFLNLITFPFLLFNLKFSGTLYASLIAGKQYWRETIARTAQNL